MIARRANPFSQKALPMPLFTRNRFAINAQAKAVYNYLEAYDGVEVSWNDDIGRYEASPSIAEWHNGREHGFVVSLEANGLSGPQKNIVFYEHPNSDQICAREWEEKTRNPPHISSKAYEEAFNDKFDYTHFVKHGQAAEMAAWIMKRLQDHWLAHNSNPQDS